MRLLGDVTTPRLHGRCPELADLDALERIWTDIRVSEDAWPAELRTADDAERVLRQTIAHWERFGFGAWSVAERATGELVGRVGLAHTRVTGSPEVELAWFLDPDAWGQGYATEMGLKAVRAAFDVLELDAIVALVLPENESSIAVTLRVGLRYERDVEHDGLTHKLFRLDRLDAPPAG